MNIDCQYPRPRVNGLMTKLQIDYIAVCCTEIRFHIQIDKNKSCYPKLFKFVCMLIVKKIKF